jgi:hypothetical protein
MDRAEKIDCRANSEIGFKGIKPLCAEFSEMSLLMIHPRLVSAKRNGVPFQLFQQKIVRLLMQQILLLPSWSCPIQ